MIEGTAQTEYASLSGKIKTFVVDKTLSISGACADAKATGEEIERLNDEVETAKGEYEKVAADMDKLAKQAADAAIKSMTAEDLNAYEKEEVLADSVKGMYGLSSAATPNAVFMALKMPAGYYGFEVTAKFSDGTPAAGLELKGLLSFEGKTAVTNEDGFCYAMTQNTSETVDFTDYLGIVGKTVTLQIDTSVVYTPVEITVEKETAMHILTTSCTKRSYKGATLDFCAVGGGGGGCGKPSAGTAGGGGGGGGYVTNVFDVQGGEVFSFTIGAAGARGSTSYVTGGGTTTVVKNGTTIASAAGGQAGQPRTTAAGNGIGGYDSAGGNGTTYVFNDTSLPRPGGGGGGGYGGGCAGGLDFGGKGGYNENGSSATGYGGGGGGATGDTIGDSWTGPFSGGNGYQGAVYVRARYV